MCDVPFDLPLPPQTPSPSSIACSGMKRPRSMFPLSPPSERDDLSERRNVQELSHFTYHQPRNASYNFPRADPSFLMTPMPSPPSSERRRSWSHCNKAPEKMRNSTLNEHSFTLRKKSDRPIRMHEHTRQLEEFDFSKLGLTASRQRNIQPYLSRSMIGESDNSIKAIYRRTPNPLELPELLMIVLELLIPDEGLFNCLFVSKKWNACTTKLLWKHVRLENMTNALQFFSHFQRSADVPAQDTNAITSTLISASSSFSPSFGEMADFYPPPSPHFIQEHEYADQSAESKIENIEQIRGCKESEVTKMREPETETVVHKYAANVRSLICRKLKYLINPKLIAAASAMSQLRSLEFYICETIGDQTILSFARNCARLTDIRLPGCNLITNRSVFEIAENCSELSHLDLRACGKITDEAIIRVAHGCSNLVHINVGRVEGGDGITDRAVQRLAAFTQVNTLGLAGCRITDQGVLALARYRHATLERVSLNSCGMITDLSIAALTSRCPKLAVVELKGCLLLRRMRDFERLLSRKVLVELCDTLRIRFESYLSLSTALGRSSDQRNA